ncbi:hypothetical protein D3C72_877690 [compost metagenome]
MLAILLAVGGAVGTYAMNHSVSKGTLAPVQGYIKNNPVGTSCTESITCSDQVFDVCTVNGLPTGTQLWKKNGEGRCILEVYKPH